MVKHGVLDKNNIENFMSLTSLQQGMLFHYISDEESNMYHEQLSLTLRGDLKIELLRKAWQFVIDNNEMLRTIFRWKGIEKPIQVVLKQYEIPIKYLDFVNEEDKEGLIEEVKLKDLDNRIDITRETLRIYVCKLDANTHEMIVSNHHILYDGWSNGIILKEVMEAYSCLYEEKELKKINKPKFSQFVKYLSSVNKEEEKKYWSSYLDGLDDRDDYFSFKDTGVHKEISYKINDIKVNKIKDFSKENKILLSAILYGAWGVLLQKFNNSKEVLFGATVSGRPENISSVDKMVGLFINTVPLRVKSDEKTTLIELIKSLDKSLNERKGFENTSLIDIKEYCGMKSNEDLFNSIVTIENYPLDFEANKGNVLSIQECSIIEQTNYNMALEILTFDGIEFKFNFNNLSINEIIVDKLGIYLERIIEDLLIDPNIEIENIDLLSETEKNQILYEFNDTKVDYPKDKTIHELFEAQVEKTPDNIAVVFENDKLTYRELNERANSLARVLRENGVKADSIVGIMVERSLEMIVGIMGILKAGGAYLPIDLNYPKERIEYMLKDSKSKVLLSTANLIDNIEFDGEVINLFNEELFKNEPENLDKINTSSDLAYVIYTSGTTGNPKGVMCEHKNVNNLVYALRTSIYNMYTDKLRVAIVAPYYFDASVQQIFTTLISGNSLYIVPEDTRKDGEELLKYYERNCIDISDGTPIHLSMIANFISKESKLNLKQLIIGGDKLEKQHVRNIFRMFSNIKISNVYGPTECCVDSSIYLIEAKKMNQIKNISIGKPIKNTSIYILNTKNQIAPIGVYGEIYISGDGLARGYLNRPDLTAERFVDNPFEVGTKMYRTGDLGRWLPDGNIEFLGRVDNQVKIRGFRIELGEIENRLLQHENIKEAAVLVKESKDNEKYICAYVVSEKNLQELNLKNYLKESLPEYMVPTYFVQVEKMPLTTNGKLDRRALPEPNLEASLTEYEAPRNEVEETLVRIWSEVLGIKKVGINDNFFDLGGHSLKATILMSKIHKELNREVPLKELFKSPTIKELGKYIESVEENPYSKIEKVEEKEYYEVSSAQKRMYMLQQFDKDSIAYNMPAVFELEGKVDKKKIEETFRKLIQRHESVRTYFETLNGEIIQKLQNNYEFSLEHINDNGNVKDIINNFVRSFDLEKAPLFRVELVENNEKYYLLIDMHHIISDGLSMEILINEFTEMYGGKTLEPLKLQYKDFAAWQNNFLNSEEMKQQEEYWISRFSDEIPVLNMPTDYERPAMQSFEGNSVSFELNEEVTLKLRKLIKETGTTMHMALLSAFNILLSKYSGQEDIVIGTPIAGRPHADLQNIMGMFVNTLALRNKPEGDKKYIDFLKEVKENSLKAYENQSYQFETLVEKLDIRRDTSRNTLFDAMFNMVDTVTGGDIKLDDIILKLYSNENKVSKFDLTLNALENDEKLSFTIDYCSKLFKKETIERLSKHYTKILDSIAKNAEIKLKEIDLLSEAERNQILYEFNDTKVDYPKDKTIHELFEAQVERTPDNIAVVFEDKKLTYKELNARSNSLARVLRDKGVKADSIVGIMVERSLEMLVGIMGILKAGGTYLPIDPNYPKERIEYMLEDSKSKVLLSTANLIDNIEFDGEVIDLFSEELFKNESENLEKINMSSDLAYVIYTSGTTGNPKGVMCEHKNVNNFINCFSEQFDQGFDSNDIVLSLTNYVFDVSVCEFFVTLTSGATLVINDKHKTFDPKEISNLILNNNVTFSYIPPSLLLSVYEELISYKNDIKLNKILVGVEAITGETLSRFYDLNCDIEIVNGYGPTEATICSTFYKINGSEDGKKAIPIGKSIGNSNIYILNNDLGVVPVCVKGEIFVSGAAVGRGYLNRPELTSEKFIDNPFELGRKMYRTGDLARWLPDGNIEFLGRIDNQVKIRGFRIELGEIENRLLQYENIKEAVVLVKENKDSEKYICAYVVSEKNVKELNLKSYLKEILPEYMVPAYFVQVENMPLTANGKLDRRALPEPNLDSNLTEYEEPRNEVEKTLVRIWSEVLGVKKVGINDNFFDLGGHSLKATMLMSKIHKELNKEVPLKELFKSPTIKELGKYIESVEENPYSKIEKVEEKEYYEASSAQKRMYMLQQFDKDSIAYNMPAVFELEGKVDKKKIEETFRKLIQRQESLRTYFETLNGEIIQRLQNNYEFRLEHINDNGNIKDIINNFVRPFDLEKPPLLRVELVENKEKDYLLIDMHHIISDGLSMEILINEFTEMYEGKTLKPLKLQYKDFAAWQNNFLNSEEMKQQEEYWISRFSDEIPVLNMPTDYERPAMQSFEGNSVSFELNEEVTLKLRKLIKETGTTMHMALLSAFNILLSKYSGQEDIVIGTPIAGRLHADLQNIMGMFVNTLALRNKPEGDKKYIDFLKEVKENSLKAYENQSYQLEALVEKLGIRRDTSRNTLFDVMFNMVDTVTGVDIKLDDIVLKSYNNENKVAKFDLTLNALENDEKLSFTIDYCSKLFNNETIERLSCHYIRILDSIAKNAEIKLKDINLLSETERNQILYEFNDTKVDYPKDKTIHELFEAQVEKTPDNIAVVFEDKKLTYRELNEKSNSLARVLRYKGIESDSIVGIMVERSLEMIVGIMGILKAGGAYLPIDPNYPKERIEYMLKDSASTVLLSTANLIDNIQFDGEVINLFNEELFKGNVSNPNKINTSSNLAYVIYTSGTTGNPKGTMVEHRCVVNTLISLSRRYPLEDRDFFLLKTTYTFDVSVTELFGWFIGGGASLVIIKPNEHMDLTSIINCVHKFNVTRINFVPSMLSIFNEIPEKNLYKVRSLKYLFVAGEEIKSNIVCRFYNKFKTINLENLYGPTETTIYSSMYSIAKNFKSSSIPIGKSLSNTKMYIMNNKNNLLPIGVPGELCISGDGVARGYVNRADLTEEKFVDNPFELGTKMYKTGDLARWLPDGNIEFLGRIDNQVKIRGFRIELGEIENRLLQHENIKEAAVLVKESKDNEKYICAYVVSEKNLQDLNLKNYLKESLPEYMVPTYFVQIENIPLTTNGKLDRRSLPEPNLGVSLTEYEAPRNEVEETLVRIWSELLGIKKVGINDNFFDLGGHSLKATMLMSKIHKELNREVPLKELFKSPTIKELGRYIESVEENPYSKIEKVEEKEYYEASSAQKRMYMLQQFDKGSIAYNMPAVFELEGKVDKKKIEETFRKLIQRHESLRTYFETLNGEIIQRIQNNYEFRLEHINDNGNIKDIINNFVRSFDLEKAPLFRVELVENKEKYYLLIDMHHIISDGLSMEILINEFTKIYEGKTLEPLKLQYKDFATWQNNFLNSEEMKQQEEYWISRFSDEIPVLNMPTDYERLAIQSFEGDSVTFEVDEDITLKLRRLIKETGTTMHMALLSAFNILLSKYSGQEDIVIGTPVAGRSHADLQNIIGMFVNTLALRNKPEEDKKYIDFLREVKENSIKAYENQNYQLETLVEKLDIRRETSRNPLFDVMFNMVDTVTSIDIKVADIILKSYRNENKVSKFDLTLNALENDEKLSFTIEYCSKLFKKETIERLSCHYIRILDSIAKNAEIKLREIDLLSEAERNQILYEFNDTKVDYPKDKTIHELFEAQVERTPDNIAVVFEDKKLTYRELNERSNSLARVLRDKGVKADSIVGIMVERSLEMIIGIMGILKAGGAYLPIDVTNPKERIEYIINDAQVDTLVISGKVTKSLEFSGNIIDITDENIFIDDNSNLNKINNYSDLAYVIYTSGSTGKPKGVMIEHKQFNNFIQGITKEIKLLEYQSILCITTISFDIFGLETLVPLTQGLKVVVASEEEHIDGEKLSEIIEKNNVELMQSTPSRLNMLLCSNRIKKSLRGIKALLVGGEEISTNLVQELKHYEKLNVYNVYGPTETTIWSTIKFLNKEEKITIGKPISNTQIYVLNNNQLAQIGVPGELCIAGDGLARGYLNRPELTSEKFVDNPFNLGAKMYKTGDLARWLPDGNIEFLGRIDNQVKIRGFRIELGEIENRLLQHENVKGAVVLVKKNKESEKDICAYIVSNKEVKDLYLREYLKESLPDYMVPAYFVQVENMPLTANGKLDRRALPEPNRDVALTEYEAPRNEVEKTLVRIWREVLGISKVGINDNFFDLGGHSLKATMLMSKIHKELNKEVPLKELFKSSTIKELGKYIESVEENPYSKIEKVEEKEYYEASSAQKRMYMLQQFDKDSIAYNMPAVFELEGKVDKKKIEETFRKLVQRHEALRTYFETLNGEIIQRLQNNYEFRLEHINENGNIKDIINNFVRPFDLEKAPLLRVELVENNEKYYLLVDMHHIISDGLSMEILINEFTEMYEGKTLKPLKLQYKDFAAWQNNFLNSEEMKQQEEYWISRFSDEIPVLNMPTDYERPAMQSFEGNSVSFELNEEVTLKLRKLIKETGTTMHMALLSAFNILLSKYSGQEDIVIGTPIAGRLHADLQNIMGMFVNTLALRNKPEGDKKYIDFLKEVKENSLKAYENQSYQLEALVEKLGIRRDTSRNTLFDVMFNMVDTVTGVDIKLDDIVLKSYNNENKVAKFDLTLNALENDEKLSFTIDYCSKLFNNETIERLSKHYTKILDSIAKNAEIKLKEIDLLSEAERNQILYEFNDTNIEYPKDKTIYELFEAQVERTPDNIAVVFEDKKLTYRELNERSNSLARLLRDKGVKADSIVGIMVERSLEMLVGIMGILKAGGAYLPIDPNYPKERIEYMLKDSESKMLLSMHDLVKSVEFDGEIIDLFNENLFVNDPSNLQQISSSNNLVYVIYTSGTTGNPKGVMIEHKSLNNYIEYSKNNYCIEEKLYMPLYTSVSFDLTVTSIFTPLVSGNSIIIHENVEIDKLIKKVFCGENQSIIKLTPAHLSLVKDMMDINKSIIRFIVGGEELTGKVAKSVSDLFDNKIEIINEYGPTEATVGCIIHKYDYKKNYRNSVLIGKPINNTQIYILDFNSKLLPVGVAGEIYIGGDVLARGYLNKPELTAEKFVDNPFEPGTKMYKTGDLARWLPDGNIEFLGRIDNQVKIRGFRIELGEIENRLLQHKFIKEAAILVKENKENKEKYICAYVVSDLSLEELKLKNYLKQTLPEYMIPTYFMQLDKIPLTQNGKIDRRSLPEPNLDAILIEYEAPRNKIEKTLARIWSEILGFEKIGINNSFFEVGGNSLNVIILIDKIKKEFKYELSLNSIYSNSTIVAMADEIGRKIDTGITIKQIEDELNKNITECRLVNTIVENEEYITLFTNSRENEIVEYIKENYSIKFIPNFILKFDKWNDNWHLFKTKNEFIGFINSQKGESQNYLDKIILFNNYRNELRDQIVNNKIINKYRTFYLQDEFIERNEVPIIAMTILIENEISVDNIVKTIKELINRNAMLRSTIIKEDNKNYFIEFDTINSLKLNYIDISDLNSIQYEDLSNKVTRIDNIQRREYNFDGKDILYRIIILKENMKSYRVVFRFDHKIFDAASKNILNKQFYKIYNEIKEKGSYESILEETSYNKLIKFVNEEHDVNKLNDTMMDNDFIKLKNELEQFSCCFEKKIEGLSDNIIFSEPVILEYDVSKYLEEGDDFSSIAIYLTCCILNRIFNMEKIPLNIVSGWRNFGEYNFSNIIGDCRSFNPIVFDMGEMSVKYCKLKKEMEDDKFCKSKKVNLYYMSSSKFKDTREGEEILKILKKSRFHMNFSGEREINEAEVIKEFYELKDQRIKNKFYYLYRVTIYVFKNKMSLVLMNGIPHEILEEIKQS
ncbi:non-ribosomal peptide synthase/polyketide synthase [Inconstantimicrobium mannanitabidum]|uniref:Uncharacterized protein n=1 Tax=Inconstantimicrobium mannanitabidum TaxID=1604901 RepID=A0ACB5R7Q4_9CLOT|nr:non-ribosomal peptide synthase/polyketide synthase [Clostridium sp. TW13]GKX65197.1 hypothetical protein rsdtw13_04550 [Clostridium sp. TW13]